MLIFACEQKRELCSLSSLSALSVPLPLYTLREKLLVFYRGPATGVSLSLSLSVSLCLTGCGAVIVFIDKSPLAVKQPVSCALVI